MSTLRNFHEGQMVRTSDGDTGQVDRLDEDENIVYVRVSLPNGGIDVVDIDPADLTPLETTD